jgi:hypothetical protein
MQLSGTLISKYQAEKRRRWKKNPLPFQSGGITVWMCAIIIASSKKVSVCVCVCVCGVGEGAHWSLVAPSSANLHPQCVTLMLNQ